MASITIDNIEYDTEAMSSEALANLRSIQFVDGELARLQSQISVLNTARLAYAAALQQLLSDVPEVAPQQP